jgi:hypothetical protein
MGLTAWNTKTTRCYRHDRMLSVGEWRDREKALADAQRATEVAEQRRSHHVELLYLDQRKRRSVDRLVLQTVAVLAAFVVVLAFIGQCEAQAEPPDAEALELAARMAAWRPTWVGAPGELDTVADAIVRGCRQVPWPDAARCPALTAALAFRESSWRVGARGRLGEVGLLQLNHAARQRRSIADTEKPTTNVLLGLAWLKRCAFMCGLAGHRESVDALSLYAGLRCRSSAAARLVERWADELEVSR